MHIDFFIADLRKQKDQLDELILTFKRKEQLNNEDLFFYDLTTKQIEKGLRTLRQRMCEEISKKALDKEI